MKGLTTSNQFKNFLNKYQHPSDEICEKHNCHKVVFDLPKPHTVCEQCQQEAINTRSNNIVKSSVSRIERRKSYGVLTKDSLIPDDDLKDASFSTFNPNDDESSNNLRIAKLSAKKFLEDAKFNLILSGPPGRGKSHLALSILKAVNEQSQGKITCMFINTDDLFFKIRDSWSNKDNGFTAPEVISRLSKVDLLVLDDLGSEATMQSRYVEAKDYIQQPLYEVLRKRSRKSTIITTNMDSEKLNATYNGKIISRVLKGVTANPKEQVIKFTSATADKRILGF
ncbi:ATP-binding protein [Apilactobacillus micheneri]|uniref:ATP-binding protein n=1 Tax=Apilactobacillus micheneri TaxID=1899430 RepID=UPI0015E83789|nr:ATP-binding protein [Apilactobacillus micheneri]